MPSKEKIVYVVNEDYPKQILEVLEKIDKLEYLWEI